MLKLAITFNKNKENFIDVGVILLCSITSLLFYIYMASPLKVSISDYTFIDSVSHFDQEEYKKRVINLAGWFYVDKQNASDQFKKEIVLSDGNLYYSYPVQYFGRPDVAKAFPNVYKNDGKFKRLGFTTQISTRFIEKGTYHVYIKYVYNGTKFISDLKKEIVVK